MARNQSLVAATFAAIACSSGALATSNVVGGYLADERRVGVPLTTFPMEPRVLHLKSGLPIFVRVSNDSAIAQFLTAHVSFARAAIAPAGQPKIVNARIALCAKRNVAIIMISRSGRYPVKCSHPLHKRLGMMGTMVVDP